MDDSIEGASNAKHDAKRITKGDKERLLADAKDNMPVFLPEWMERNPDWPERGTKLFTKMLDRVIEEIGGNPESSAWDDWDITDLLTLGEMAHRVREVHGATLTIELPKRARKPGPKPMMPHELMELYFDMQQLGWTQEVYSGRKHVSRYTVQQATKYCQENPDIFRQFQAEKLLE